MSAEKETSGAAGLTNAAHDVMAERQRQMRGEGWSQAHDDKHKSGEMALAAACYAAHAQLYRPFYHAHDGSPDLEAIWPWDQAWWKPKDKRHDLVRAGALILAEIERLDRATAQSQESANPSPPPGEQLQGASAPAHPTPPTPTTE